MRKETSHKRQSRKLFAGGSTSVIPVGKGYIGPSTKRAIEAFKNKEEFESLGTTSGAPMRAFAPVLCSPQQK